MLIERPGDILDLFVIVGHRAAVESRRVLLEGKLSPMEIAQLRGMRRIGVPVSAAHLAKEVSCSRLHATVGLRRLRERGFVEDAEGTLPRKRGNERLTQLTQAGHECLAKADYFLDSVAIAMLERITPETKSRLVDALVAIRATAQERAELQRIDDLWAAVRGRRRKQMRRGWL